MKNKNARKLIQIQHEGVLTLFKRFWMKLTFVGTTIKMLIFISVPSVSVEGQQEKHVMAGSLVQLKCFIKNCLKQPSYVFWWVVKCSSLKPINVGGKESMFTTKEILPLVVYWGLDKQAYRGQDYETWILIQDCWTISRPILNDWIE